MTNSLHFFNAEHFLQKVTRTAAMPSYGNELEGTKEPFSDLLQQNCQPITSSPEARSRNSIFVIDAVRLVFARMLRVKSVFFAVWQTSQCAERKRAADKCSKPAIFEQDTLRDSGFFGGRIDRLHWSASFAATGDINGQERNKPLHIWMPRWEMTVRRHSRKLYESFTSVSCNRLRHSHKKHPVSFCGNPIKTDCKSPVLFTNFKLLCVFNSCG